MDALSSQATVSGYKAVIMAADRLPKFFPLLITAAGTVAPAKALILAAAGCRPSPPPAGWARWSRPDDTRSGGQGAGAEPGRPLRRARGGRGEGAQDARGYATALSDEQQAEQQRQLEAHIPTPTWW